MSNPLRNSPTLDPRTDRRLRRKGLCPTPPRKPSLTPVECLFTATQACNQLWASQEPLGNINEEEPEEPAVPEHVPTPPSETDQSPNPGLPTELLNLDLRSLLAALAQQNQPRHQKKHRGICEPDTFSGGTTDDLRAFIFQCQIYFRAYEGDFREDSEKVYFAISYLRGLF